MNPWSNPRLAWLLRHRVAHALGLAYYAARFRLSTNRDKRRLAPKLWRMGLAGLRPMDAAGDYAWYEQADPLAHRAAYLEHTTR